MAITREVTPDRIERTVDQVRDVLNSADRARLGTRSNQPGTKNVLWIMAGALILSFLCHCSPPPIQAEPQVAKESPIPPRDTSEQIKEVSTSQLKEWLNTHQKLMLIDVREDNEWQEGHAASAIHISRGTLSEKVGTVAPDKATRIVLYCLGGVRSAAAAATLQKLGYRNVLSLAGGFKNYKLAGLPIEK